MTITVKVSAVCEWVNTRLACQSSSLHLKDLTPEQAFRLGAASLYEQIAHATGNYRGFNYQASEWDGKAQALRDGYDESRRLYHPPAK